ncbi:tRNA nucleotidyltransferase [Pseudoflavonifractor phocaeensis]|nr:tRNA nucleotidyltransferase [Pseudoflavonifractor phocaeensis]MBM6924689.1 tRNA nucleotidyltransferase [Pseudoflavonifractor phocaeensis]
MALWSIPVGVAFCLERLRQSGHAAHPVGGCVRDLLRGERPEDYDVCTSALPEQVMDLFDRTIPTGLKHGTVTVLTEDGPVEVTTFRREGGYADGRHPDGVAFDVGLEEDLARRDFTVNAMALGPDREIIDPFGGRVDLAAGIIRCVGDPDTRFREDALRMLRAVRFAAKLDYIIEPDTRAAILRNAGRMALVSGERIKGEVEKILLSPRPAWVGELLRWGLLVHLWPVRDCPDLTGLAELPQEPIPRWRGFCQATGFPLECLPVERALKRGVYHPELEVIRRLALSGGELATLGLKGAEIGAVQRELAVHVLDHPEDNLREVLVELAQQRLEGRKIP